MSEKKHDQAYAHSSVLFHRIRDRLIANRHSAASSIATSTISKSLITTVSQYKCKSFNRKRIELINQRFLHRVRQFVQRYTVCIFHCFAIRTASTTETLSRLTEGNKHQIQRIALCVCVCVCLRKVSFFRFRFRAKKIQPNDAFRRVS